jgi:hypothetical protein
MVKLTRGSSGLKFLELTDLTPKKTFGQKLKSIFEIVKKPIRAFFF